MTKQNILQRPWSWRWWPALSIILGQARYPRELTGISGAGFVLPVTQPESKHWRELKHWRQSEISDQRFFMKGRIARRAVTEDWMIPSAASCYSRLNDPFCWERCSRERLPMLLNGLDNNQKIASQAIGSRPPSNTCFLGPTSVSPPKRNLDQFSRFLQSSQTWPTDRHTRRQTDHATQFVAIAHILYTACDTAYNSFNGLIHLNQPPASDSEWKRHHNLYGYSLTTQPVWLHLSFLYCFSGLLVARLTAILWEITGSNLTITTGTPMHTTSPRKIKWVLPAIRVSNDNKADHGCERQQPTLQTDKVADLVWELVAILL